MRGQRTDKEEGYEDMEGWGKAESRSRATPLGEEVGCIQLLEPELGRNKLVEQFEP